MLTNTAFLLFELLALMSAVPRVQCEEETQQIRKNGLKISNSELPIAKQKVNAPDRNANFKLTDRITVKEFVDPEKGFLAGEDTPVWLAEGHGKGKDVTYEKLAKGAVKDAVEYWTNYKKKGMPFTVKGYYSDSDRQQDKVFEFTKRTSESFGRKKVSPAPPTWVPFHTGTQWGSVYRPSVLAIVDFETEWPSYPLAEKVLIRKRILYALAFWNGVDLQLRHYGGYDESIHLRIAGIVIAKNRGAVPYNYDSAMKYWVSMTRKNADFTERAYHIAATVTDDRGKFFGPIKSISSDNGHYCASVPPIFVTMALDNRGFSGLQSAVHEIVHLLGAAYNSVPFPLDDTDSRCRHSEGTVMAAEYSDLGRKWTPCIVEQIRSRMRGSGMCMQNASEYHQPGKPVERILPGLFYRAEAQCQAGGWVDVFVCWNYVTCGSLFCAANSIWSSCKRYGAPQDGTKCGKKKICLDGQCVATPEFLLN